MPFWTPEYPSANPSGVLVEFDLEGQRLQTTPPIEGDSTLHEGVFVPVSGLFHGLIDAPGMEFAPCFAQWDSEGNVQWFYLPHLNHSLFTVRTHPVTGKMLACFIAGFDGVPEWTLADLHTDVIFAIDVSLQGFSYSGSRTDDGSIRKVDPEGTEVTSGGWPFTGHTGSVRVVRVKGDFVYSGGSDATVRKLAESNASQQWSVSLFASGVEALDVDDNGFVFAGGLNQIIRKIDPDGDEVTTDDWPFTAHSGFIRSIFVGDDGFVYSASNDGTVRKFSASTGTEVTTGNWPFTGHTGTVNAVVQKGDFVYSAGTDGTVRKFQASDATEITSGGWPFTGHTDTVTSVKVNNDGFVYSASRDNLVKQIDPDGFEVWSFDGHEGEVEDLALEEDEENEFLFSAGEDKSVVKLTSTGGLLDDGVMLVSPGAQEHEAILPAEDEGLMAGADWITGGEYEGMVLWVDQVNCTVGVSDPDTGAVLFSIGESDPDNYNPTAHTYTDLTECRFDSTDNTFIVVDTGLYLIRKIDQEGNILGDIFLGPNTDPQVGTLRWGEGLTPTEALFSYDRDSDFLAEFGRAAWNSDSPLTSWDVVVSADEEEDLSPLFHRIVEEEDPPDEPDPPPEEVPSLQLSLSPWHFPVERIRTAVEKYLKDPVKDFNMLIYINSALNEIADLGHYHFTVQVEVDGKCRNRWLTLPDEYTFISEARHVDTGRIVRDWQFRDGMVRFGSTGTFELLCRGMPSRVDTMDGDFILLHPAWETPIVWYCISQHKLRDDDANADGHRARQLFESTSAKVFRSLRRHRGPSTVRVIR